MSSLIPQLIVVGLLASISPVAVTVLVTLMLTKKPLRNALSFLVGFTLVLVAIGVIAVFILHIGTSKGNHAIDAWIDIGLGVLCLALIPHSLMRKAKADKQRTKPLKTVEALGIGAVTMMINASTIVIYISGTHDIVAAHLSAVKDVEALAILTAVTLVTLIIPIAIYAIFPKKSDRLLGSLKVWLMKHQKMIGIVILAIFGIYLLFKGIKILV
ncbi:MAG: GAP family protein [Candidatus Geothermincolia bacterium]